MKAIAILIVLAGTTVLCIEAALPNMGTCTYEAYNNKIRTCQTQFIKGLQRNPKADCNIYLESLLNCSALTAESCFPRGGMDTEILRKSLKQTLTEELMCKRAGLQYPNPSALNITLPCGITFSEYVTKMNDCSSGMVKKWSANRADPTLCREYWNVKNCFFKTVGKYCQFAELLKHDNYNPFCANNVDPPSKVSTIVISKAVIAISLVVAAIQAF